MTFPAKEDEISGDVFVCVGVFVFVILSKRGVRKSYHVFLNRVELSLEVYLKLDVTGFTDIHL